MAINFSLSLQEWQMYEQIMQGCEVGLSAFYMRTSEYWNEHNRHEPLGLSCTSPLLNDYSNISYSNHHSWNTMVCALPCAARLYTQRNLGLAPKADIQGCR